MTRLAVAACLGAFLARPALPAETSIRAAEPLSPAALGGTVLDVSVEPLVPAAFKPFGEVIELPAGQAPTLDSGAVKWWGGLAKDRIAEEVEFGMMTAAARPREAAELQRHLRSPECLVGLSGEWWILVAPPTLASRPLLASRVRAFLVKPGQAVLLHRGTWHSDPFPKADPGLFLVAVRDGTLTKDHKSRPFKGKEAVRIP